jgi:cytochrome c-type biogenesis protein
MDFSDVIKNVNIPVLSALLLGLVTAINPCPMATNIAAIAYISRGVANKKYAVITGLLYTLGRMVSYTVIGVLIVLVGLEIPGVALFLQDFGGKILGPLMLAMGILMLFIDRFPVARGGGGLAILGGKVANWGMVGGFLLGIIFALAFCPTSAVIYFGVLMPIALKVNEGMVLPAVFAIGTGLPVLILGTMISLGVAGVTTWLNAINRAEKVIRVLVAIIFIGIGIYYMLQWVTNF